MAKRESDRTRHASIRSQMTSEELQSKMKRDREYYKTRKKKAYESTQKWRINNPDKIKKIRREAYSRNQTKEKIRAKKHREKHPEAHRTYVERYMARHPDWKIKLQAWKNNNPEKMKAAKRKWEAQNLKNNPSARILKSLRCRLLKALDWQSSSKSASTMTLLGCSVDEFRKHLESLWKPGMNWDNYGLYGWHIDHIRPCASFDLTKPEQQKKCFHWTNLQPLWAKINLEKGSKKQWINTDHIHSDSEETNPTPIEPSHPNRESLSIPACDQKEQDSQPMSEGLQPGQASS